MCRAILVVGVICGVLAAAPFAQQKDAAAVLAEMRQALGGAAALDGVKTLSVSGSQTLTTPAGVRGLGFEWLVMLPDHYLEIRRDAPPVPDIVTYTGMAGDRLIRKTEARFSIPEIEYADKSPAAVAERERFAVSQQRQTLARLMLTLLGKSTSVFPLQVAYAGIERAEGRAFDVIEAAGTDEFRCTLHIDGATHLPAMLTWHEKPSLMTVASATSIPVVRGPAPIAPTAGRSATIKDPNVVVKRWIFSGFKAQDGILWPRKIEEEFGDRSEEIRVGRYEINRKLDARKFTVK